MGMHTKVDSFVSLTCKEAAGRCLTDRQSVWTNLWSVSVASKKCLYRAGMSQS